MLLQFTTGMSRSEQHRSRMQHGSFVTSNAGIRIPGIRYGTAWKKADTTRLTRPIMWTASSCIRRCRPHRRWARSPKHTCARISRFF